jgi:hypothetical protein
MQQDGKSKEQRAEGAAPECPSPFRRCRAHRLVQSTFRGSKRPQVSLRTNYAILKKRFPPIREELTKLATSVAATQQLL